MRSAAVAPVWAGVSSSQAVSAGRARRWHPRWRAGYVLALEGSPALGQGGGVAPQPGWQARSCRPAQGLTGRKVGGQVLGHSRHTGGTSVHALDLGAGQLLVRLDIETAIAPQGARGGSPPGSSSRR